MSTIKQLVNGAKIIPVVVINNVEQADGLSDALLEGGVNVIEITLRSDYALAAMQRIKKRHPQMVVIAGTVNDEDDMGRVQEAGVDAAISPGYDGKLVDIARNKGLAYMPGVATASEVMAALQAGVYECKLFPATVVGGIGALKAFSGPFAEMSFCPTGGVSENNYLEFLKLPNVICVGGSWLASSRLIDDNAWSAITQICKQSLSHIDVQG